MAQNRDKDQDLIVFLCVEDVGNCDILLNQLGSGQVFGQNQRVRLVLQGCDERQLEALTWDIQDCAFPLVSGVSTSATFANAGLLPDAVMVLLADRDRGRHLESSLSVSELAGDNKRFPDLYGLVHYTENLADVFAGDFLRNTPIVLLGDFAHTAASLLSRHLSAALGADQMIALDGREGNPTPRHLLQGKGQMSKVNGFCHALKQWWFGQQTHPHKKAELGTKFVNTKSETVEGKSTGYFFSVPVDFTAPTGFSARLGLDVDQCHIAEVKAHTDAAHALIARGDGEKNEQHRNQSYHIAHL